MKSIKLLGIIALAFAAQNAAAHGSHDHHHGHKAQEGQSHSHHGQNPHDGRYHRTHGYPATTERTPHPHETCRSITKEEVAALFDRWNASLATGKPAQVVANYDADSILLPTLSNTPRLTAAEKEDYFVHFLENQPQGRIDQRHIQIGCNTALDAGLYTFTFAKNGQTASGRYSYTYRWNGKEWLITHHHSSLMPETDKSAAH